MAVVWKCIHYMYDTKWSAEFDYDVSPWQNRMTIAEDRLPVAGPAIMRVKPKQSARKVREWDIIPGTGQEPVANQRVRDLLDRVCTSELRYLPVDLVCKDETISDYQYIVPVERRLVADLDKFIVKRWLVPGRAPSRFTNFRLQHNIVGPYEVVRDDASDLVVIGDELAETLNEAGLRDLDFIDEEDVQDWWGTYRYRKPWIPKRLRPAAAGD